jgi:hypothetical protein
MVYVRLCVNTYVPCMHCGCVGWGCTNLPLVGQNVGGKKLRVAILDNLSYCHIVSTYYIK